MDQTSYDNQDIQTWNNFDYANQPMDNPNQFIINTTFAEGTVPAGTIAEGLGTGAKYTVDGDRNPMEYWDSQQSRGELFVKFVLPQKIKGIKYIARGNGNTTFKIKVYNMLDDGSLELVGQKENIQVSTIMDATLTVPIFDLNYSRMVIIHEHIFGNPLARLYVHELLIDR